MTIPDALRLDALDRHREYGAIFIRLLVGGTLIYMSQDNVFSWARMLEFRDFLAERGVPAPLVAAPVSVYAQFIAGWCVLLGFLTRPAALVMVVNFVAALLIAHVGAPFSANIAPLSMLAGSLFLLVHGPGRPALDAVVWGRRVPGARARSPG